MASPGGQLHHALKLENVFALKQIPGLKAREDKRNVQCTYMQVKSRIRSSSSISQEVYRQQSWAEPKGDRIHITCSPKLVSLLLLSTLGRAAHSRVESATSTGKLCSRCSVQIRATKSGIGALGESLTCGGIWKLGLSSSPAGGR